LLFLSLPSSIVFLLLDIDFFSAADFAVAIVENTEAAGPGRREQERKAAPSLWDAAKQGGHLKNCHHP